MRIILILMFDILQNIHLDRQNLYRMYIKNENAFSREVTPLMLAVRSHRENLRQGENENADGNTCPASDALI